MFSSMFLGMVQVALTHQPLESFSMLWAVLIDYILGLLSSPHVLLAMVSNFVLDNCGFPIRGLSFPLSMLGVGLSSVLWTVRCCPTVPLGNCVCCLLSFPCFGTVDCFHHSLWVWVADIPWFGCCCWVVLATLGPRTTLCCLVDLSCAHLLFGIIPGCICLLHRVGKGLFCCV